MCALCCGELHALPTAVLLKKGRGRNGKKRVQRVCAHYFHLECLEEYRRFTQKQNATKLIGGSGVEPWIEVEAEVDMNCPLCRANFRSFQRVPDVRIQPLEWFELSILAEEEQEGEEEEGRRQRNGERVLNVADAVAALQALLPIDAESLIRKFEHEASFAPALRDLAGQARGAGAELWQRWACPPGFAPTADAAQADAEARAGAEAGRPQRYAGISKAAFANPSGGLLVWILAQLSVQHRWQRGPQSEVLRERWMVFRQ